MAELTPAPMCGTCTHFRRNAQMIGSGHCVCMPPQAIPVMQAGVPSVMPVRPPVRSIDSCGQWRAADPASPEIADGH